MQQKVLGCLGALLVVASTGGAAGQTPAGGGWQKVDVSKLGPQVGERVPDFTLADQTGQPRTLQSVMGPNGLMLVFYRSADW
jgi:cytochrome oxidase Cu insertion factor (SCO1/SenC/PrrC family)